jgi:hypothetical protein
MFRSSDIPQPSLCSVRDASSSCERDNNVQVLKRLRCLYPRSRLAQRVVTGIRSNGGAVTVRFIAEKRC